MNDWSKELTLIPNMPSTQLKKMVVRSVDLAEMI